MTDFTKILEKAKELENKMKASQEKIKNISVEGVSGSNSVKVTLNGGFPRAGLKFPDRQGVEADHMIVSLFWAECVPCGTGT